MQKKFRAWDGEKMQYDFVVYSMNGFALIVKGEIPKLYIEPENDWEVMQFTGLLDSKGREIYEEDILRCFRSDEHKYQSVVEWEHAGFILHWGASSNYGEGIMPKTPPMLHTHIDAEIIGNIYENEDLLK